MDCLQLHTQLGGGPVFNSITMVEQENRSFCSLKRNIKEGALLTMFLFPDLPVQVEKSSATSYSRGNNTVIVKFISL